MRKLSPRGDRVSPGTTGTTVLACGYTRSGACPPLPCGDLGIPTSPSPSKPTLGRAGLLAAVCSPWSIPIRSRKLMSCWVLGTERESI